MSIYSADDASQSAVVRCTIVSVFLARKKMPYFSGGLRRFVGSFQTRFLAVGCAEKFDFAKSEAELKNFYSIPEIFEGRAAMRRRFLPCAILFGRESVLPNRWRADIGEKAGGIAQRAKLRILRAMAKCAWKGAKNMHDKMRPYQNRICWIF